MFKIFRTAQGPRELTQAMVGVRLGERFVQFGPGDPAVFAALAGKAGLTGRACAVAPDAAAARLLEAAGVEEGVLIEVEIAPPGATRLEDQGFDVAVVDGNLLVAGPEGDRVAWLRDARRVLRGGARLVAVYRASRGTAAWLGLDRTTGGSIVPLITGALSEAGFQPVRLLAEREGLTFVEGFRPSA